VPLARRTDGRGEECLVQVRQHFNFPTLGRLQVSALGCKVSGEFDQAVLADASNECGGESVARRAAIDELMNDRGVALVQPEAERETVSIRGQKAFKKVILLHRGYPFRQDAVQSIRGGVPMPTFPRGIGHWSDGLSCCAVHASSLCPLSGNGGSRIPILRADPAHDSPDHIEQEDRHEDALPFAEHPVSGAAAQAVGDGVLHEGALSRSATHTSIATPDTS
jgi:hypothetical protein